MAEPRVAPRNHGVVPPYLLEQIARSRHQDSPGPPGPPAPSGVSAPPPRGPGLGGVPGTPGWDVTVWSAAERTLEVDGRLREHRSRPGARAEPAAGDGRLQRVVADAGGRQTLPGAVVRSEGDPPVPDATVNEAYDGLGSVYRFLADSYGRSSLDGRGLTLRATVHYGDRYDNAFWDGTRMVFGDGDGQVLVGFTRSLSVVGHELAHGVMQYAADLRYRGQSGALNESFADVIGALVDQFVRGHTSEQASWLIGAEVFGPGLRARGLRSMSAPGTAYDDPRLGRDPQPDHMDRYIVTQEDYGGVHLNSGIPNRAFHLAATGLGGHAWERAGRIWFDAVTSGDLPRDVDFAGFAAATVDTARDRFGDEVAGIVHRAWDGVGVAAPAAPARSGGS